MKFFIALAAAAGAFSAAALFLLDEPTQGGSGLVLSYADDGPGGGPAALAPEPVTVRATETEVSQARTEVSTSFSYDAMRNVATSSIRAVELPPPAPTDEPVELVAGGPSRDTPTETADGTEATAAETPSPEPTAEPTEEPTAPPPPQPGPSGGGLLGEVNALRASVGLSPLGHDSALSATAADYCYQVGEYYQQHGSLSHNIGGGVGDRVKAHGFSGNAWGEVLAWTADAASAGMFESVARMWWNSPGHHELLYEAGTGYGGRTFEVAGIATCTVGGNGFYVIDVGAY
jgi:uncharacterized protein YkwD